MAFNAAEHKRRRYATDPAYRAHIRAEASRQYRKDISKSRLRSRARSAERYKNDPAFREKKKLEARQWGESNKAKRKESIRAHFENLKNAVINVLTDGEGTCRWCGQGDQDVLTIDHMNNDGAAHRREFGGKHFTGRNIYRWIVQNDYPPGFQVLCCNCNTKKEILRRRSLRK
jgi:hypothetical protein